MARRFEIDVMDDRDDYEIYEWGRVVGHCGEYWNDLVREVLIANRTITKHEPIELYWR